MGQQICTAAKQTHQVSNLQGQAQCRKKTHSPNNALPGQFYFWHLTFQNYHSLFSSSPVSILSFLFSQDSLSPFCNAHNLFSGSLALACSSFLQSLTSFRRSVIILIFHLSFSDFMISLSFIITNQTILLLWEQMTVFKLIKTADSDQKARVNFLCWLLFQYPFSPVLPQ